jgi:hypothetical protein
MQTNQQKANGHTTQRRNTGGNRQNESSARTVNGVYHGIDDFLRRYPIATMNRYGERVINGVRIC